MNTLETNLFSICFPEYTTERESRFTFKDLPIRVEIYLFIIRVIMNFAIKVIFPGLQVIDILNIHQKGNHALGLRTYRLE